MMRLTEEQKEILNAVKNESRVKIKAYAGTGKTTTLVEVIKDNPDKNFLVVAFNKSVQEEFKKRAKKENLKNVVVYTLHSLAYSQVFKNCLFKGSRPMHLTTNKLEILQSIRGEIGEELREIWEVDYLNSELLSFIFKILFFLFKKIHIFNC